MKLNTINESFKGKEAIKKTAMAVASLKNILLRYQDKESLTELYSIFKTPSPKNWPRSEPLISKALTYIQNDKKITQYCCSGTWFSKLLLDFLLENQLTLGTLVSCDIAIVSK